MVGAVLVAVAGCGSSGSSGSSGSTANTSPTSSGGSSGTVSVVVGTGTPVKVSSGPLKIGIFMNAMSNSWQQALANAAAAKAKSFGWQATIQQFGFDQQAMQDALQSAATTHKYDAIVIVPIDGNGSCDMLTQTLPKANVLVVNSTFTLCGRDLKTGNDSWSPGTVAYCPTQLNVPQYAEDWIREAAKLNPGPQKVAIVGGPAQAGNTLLMKSLMQKIDAENTGFDIRDVIATDWTTPTAFTSVQAYLQAHPDTTVLLSTYSPDTTRGIVQAVQAAGMTGKVKIGDAGGSSYAIDQIKSGGVQFTLPYFPVQEGQCDVQAIKNAQDGNTSTRVYYQAKGGEQNPYFFVTKQNVDSFKPEF